MSEKENKIKKSIPDLVDILTGANDMVNEAGKTLKELIKDEFSGKLPRGTYIVNYGSNKGVAYPFLVQVDNFSNIIFIASCQYVDLPDNKGEFAVIDISSNKLKPI